MCLSVYRFVRLFSLFSLPLIVSIGNLASAQISSRISEAGIPISGIPLDINQPSNRPDLDITVVGPDEIKKSGLSSVEEMLNELESVQMVRTAGPGGSASIYIQGIGGDRVLVLLDGIELNDPISPGRSFDFVHMPLTDVQRIEVIKGASSAIYGGNALGGVINIVSKKNDPNKIGSFALELGSHKTYRGSLSAGHETESSSTTLIAGKSESEGISAASEKDGNSELDGFESQSLSARHQYKINSKSQIKISGRYSDHLAELDNRGGAGGDDPNNTLRTKKTAGKIEFGFRPYSKLNQFVTSSFNQTIRIQENLEDELNPGVEEHGYFKGTAAKTAFISKISLSEGRLISVDAGYKEERGESDTKSEGPFPYETKFENQLATSSYLGVQYLTSLRRQFFYGVVGRFESHNVSGNLNAAQISIGTRLTNQNILIRSQVSTGYKIPTLFQLFSSLGNRKLKSEKSETVSFGVEKSFSRLEIKFGIFRNLINELIDYDVATAKYLNIGAIETRGSEVGAKLFLFDDIELNATYARTLHKNLRTGLGLFRRPDHKATLKVSGFIKSALRYSVSGMQIGKRTDVDFSTGVQEIVTLDSYRLVSAKLIYGFGKSREIYLRGENIFSEDFVEVIGYGTAKRQLFTGMSYGF